MNREALELEKESARKRFDSVSEEIKRLQQEQLRLQGEYRVLSSLINRDESIVDAATIVVEESNEQQS